MDQQESSKLCDARSTRARGSIEIKRGCSIAANAVPCLGKDRGFESLHPRHLNTGEVAQKVEHWSENPGLSPVRFRSSPPSFCPILTPLKRPDLLRFNLGAIFNLLQKGKPMRLHHQSLEQFVKMKDLTPNQFLKGYAEKHLWPDIVYVYQHQFSGRL